MEIIPFVNELTIYSLESECRDYNNFVIIGSFDGCHASHQNCW